MSKPLTPIPALQCLPSTPISNILYSSCPGAVSPDADGASGAAPVFLIVAPTGPAPAAAAAAPQRAGSSPGPIGGGAYLGERNEAGLGASPLTGTLPSGSRGEPPETSEVSDIPLNIVGMKPTSAHHCFL